MRLDDLIGGLLDRHGPTGGAAGTGVLAHVSRVHTQTGRRRRRGHGSIFAPADYRGGGRKRTRDEESPKPLAESRTWHRPRNCCFAETSMSDCDTFGPRLRAERERRGISLDTIASVTKVGGDLWEGLER